MSYGYVVFVTAIYNNEEMAKKRLIELGKARSIIDLRITSGSGGSQIVGDLNGEIRDVGHEMEKVKKILEKDCVEGYLDGYTFDQTLFLHKEE